MWRALICKLNARDSCASTRKIFSFEKRKTFQANCVAGHITRNRNILFLFRVSISRNANDEEYQSFKWKPFFFSRQFETSFQG